MVAVNESCLSERLMRSNYLPNIGKSCDKLTLTTRKLNIRHHCFPLTAEGLGSFGSWAQSRNQIHKDLFAVLAAIAGEGERRRQLGAVCNDIAKCH